jgi:phage replication O-like protein O
MGFKSPNYTQIPNEMLDDWLHKLGLAELKLLMVIMRKTFGWHKLRDRISLSQLEEITGLERKHISKASKSLIEKGLITKTVEGKKGLQNTFYELVLDDDSNNCYGCLKDTGGGVFKTPTKETPTKEKESPIIPQGGSPLSSKKKPKEEKHQVAENVFLTPSQQQSLLQRLESNTDKLKACYDKLSVWKIAKGQTNINDYLNIIRWVIKAVEEDLSKPKAVDKEALDKSLAEKISKKYPGHPDISIGHNYIEFNFGPMNRPHIKFGDGGFREQVLNNLRKMHLDIREL